jgi:hypothetical protein
MFYKHKNLLLVVALIIAIAIISTGCSLIQSKEDTEATNTKAQETDSSNKVKTTAYTIYQVSTSPPIPGGMVTHEAVLGKPLSAPEAIEANAWMVPWRIDFKQVQRTSLSGIAAGCTNLQEQIVEIDGWIEIDFSQLDLSLDQLPDAGPKNIKGTVHETVTGTPGTWNCPDSEVGTQSMNTGSVQFVQSISGEHTANFSGASNITNLTVDGADVYFDLSYEENIVFIWPAGTKIKYADDDTPTALVPLGPFAQ